MENKKALGSIFSLDKVIEDTNDVPNYISHLVGCFVLHSFLTATTLESREEESTCTLPGPSSYASALTCEAPWTGMLTTLCDYWFRLPGTSRVRFKCRPSELSTIFKSSFTDLGEVSVQEVEDLHDFSEELFMLSK